MFAQKHLDKQLNSSTFPWPQRAGAEHCTLLPQELPFPATMQKSHPAPCGWPRALPFPQTARLEPTQEGQVLTIPKAAACFSKKGKLSELPACQGLQRALRRAHLPRASKAWHGTAPSAWPGNSPLQPQMNPHRASKTRHLKAPCPSEPAAPPADTLLPNPFDAGILVPLLAGMQPHGSALPPSSPKPRARLQPPSLPISLLPGGLCEGTFGNREIPLTAGSCWGAE